MKKLFAILLTVATLATSLLGLVSCGGGNTEELIVGITYYSPMNYKDAEGKLVGFETEFAEAVCAELGMTAKFQVIDWEAKVTELNAKNIDCIWNGMTIDDDRKAAMGISTPYMKNKQVLVVKAENAADYTADTDLTGKSLVAEKGSAGENAMETDGYLNKADYTPVTTQTNALMEVASGTADACVIDYVAALGSIGEGTDYEDLVVVEGLSFGAEEQYGIAFRKGDTELLARVNDAIDKLADNGTLKAIAEKYKLEDYLLVGKD